MKLRIIFVFITIYFLSLSNSMAKEKIIYKYKEYEKFDLGDLEIKGSIIAPGDLSVKERRRKIFERELFNRDNFDKKMIQEIKFLR